MREVLEDHARGWQRSGISRYHAPRCGSGARMADPLRENGVRPLRLWSPLAPLALVLAALVLALDQAFKWWMLTSVDIASRQPVAVTSFFELVLSQNRGISYGLLKTPDQWL